MPGVEPEFCARCPVRRHRLSCPARALGGATGLEACALATVPHVRQTIIGGDAGELRALLPSAFWAAEGLERETVTVFVPLSGRDAAWETHLRPWLEEQDWPRAQTRLVLCDTSQRADFSAKVRGWLEGAGYPDSHYYTQTVGRPGLASLSRSENIGSQVDDAMRAIYRRMAAELATRFVLIVEDDHRPPNDALGRLLRGFDARTAAVTGLYRGREPSGTWVCWHGKETITPAPGPAIPVSGSGFGTLLLKAEWLAGEAFAHAGGGEPAPYDVGFSSRVVRRGGLWKADRSLLVNHAGAPPITAAHHAMARGEVPQVVLAHDQGAAAREALRLSALARNCPHRGCKTGCGSAGCALGKGDLNGGKSATLAHCVRCVALPERATA